MTIEQMELAHKQQEKQKANENEENKVKIV
jgi:hypothetical protein